MKISVFLTCVFALGCHLAAANRPIVTYLDSPAAFIGAQEYKDTESGMTFRVESDGRHVTAISPDGKVRWRREPFIDAKLEPYRVERPVIVMIGKPMEWMTEGRKGRFVCLNYDSSQCLILAVQSGDPIWMGQD